MRFHPGVLKLAVLLLLTTVYGQVIGAVAGGVGSETGYYLINKGLLAILLLMWVVATGQSRAVGLTGGIEWRTLPIYWPLFVLMLLILLGPATPPIFSVLLALGLIAVSVGFAEELMFRGMLFDWFRDLSPRARVLISAFAFGGAHLAGLLSSIATPVILAQSVFASAVGAVFACARVRDRSIWLPIIIHAIFDFVALGTAGGIEANFDDSPQTVLRLLIPGLVIWVWAAWLIWRLPRHVAQTPGAVAVAEPAGAKTG